MSEALLESMSVWELAPAHQKIVMQRIAAVAARVMEDNPQIQRSDLVDRVGRETGRSKPEISYSID